jgi:hypothetical protein
MSDKNITLVILAAGLGARFGGNKQICTIGMNGESLMEFSVYDAIKAGFTKIIFITKEEVEKYLDPIVARFPAHVKVEYARQTWDNLCLDIKIPSDRIKPLGTGHAVLSAAKYVKEPFAVINADDYYGGDAFIKMAKYLYGLDINDARFSMVGYPLGGTLSSNGNVNRGICRYSTYPAVSYIEEFINIFEKNNRITGKDEDHKTHSLDADELVSLNFWGFTPVLFTHLQKGFNDFFRDQKNGETAEYYLPTAVCNMLNMGYASLDMIKSEAKWYGMTHKDDLDFLKKSIHKKIMNNDYPEKLWTS